MKGAPGLSRGLGAGPEIRALSAQVLPTETVLLQHCLCTSTQQRLLPVHIRVMSGEGGEGIAILAEVLEEER